MKELPADDFTKIPELPAFAQVEPVGECNLRCPMCLLSARAPSPKPALMPFDSYVRLLDQLPGLEELHLQGLGEPLLHPRLCDMVEEAAGRGIRVSINTNLTLLSAATAPRLARALQTIHVSVDAADPGTYEGIRSGASFRQLEQNLRLLCGTREANRPRLVFVSVLMRRTLRELPGLVRFAHRWGVDELFVQHLCRLPEEAQLEPTTPAGSEFTRGGQTDLRSFFRRESLSEQDEDLIVPTFEAARQLAASLDVSLRLPALEPAPQKKNEACDWPWRGVYVTWSGELLPCCMVALPENQTLGTLSDGGLEALWMGPEYQDFRRQLQSPNPPRVCRVCSLYAGRF